MGNTTLTSVSESQVVEAVLQLNKVYSDNPTDIQFYLDPCINYIHSHEIATTSFAAEDYWDTSTLPSTDDAIDLLLLPIDNGINGGRADGIAVGSRLVMSGFFPETTTPLIETNVLSHEIGHVLGLLHTFGPLQFNKTWRQTICCGGSSLNGPYGEPAGQAKRMVVVGQNSSGEDIYRCNVTGDNICDTQADPTFSVTSCTQTYQGQGCPTSGSAAVDCVNEDWNGDTYMPTSDNLMDYTSMECLLLFTDDQMGMMSRTITDIPAINMCLYTIPSALTISGTVIINTPVDYDTDLIVPSGATLQVTPGGMLRFAQDKGIIVQEGGTLISNGGIFTKRGCLGDEEWQGILLSRNCEISIDGNSTVEFAKIGVSYTDEYPSSSDLPTILIRNSHFSNCGAGIDINIPTGPVAISQSTRLENNQFTTCNVGISTLYTRRFRCLESEFFDCTRGIVALGSDATIVDCAFNGGTHGVVIMNFAYNSMPSRITDNFFQGQAREGLSINNSANDASYSIRDNLFLDQSTGAVLAGESRSYDVKSNDFFDCSIGTTYIGSGDGPSENWQNVYSGMFFSGMLTQGANTQLDLRRDCFSNVGWSDVILGGTMGIIQGDDEFSNSNEFSKIPGVPSFANFFVSSFVVNYLTKIGSTSIDIRVPFQGNPVTIDPVSVEWRTDACGASNIVPPQIDKCPCGLTTSGTIEQIIRVMSAIRALESNTTLNKYYKRYLLAKYEQCLLKLLNDCLRGIDSYDDKGLTSGGMDFVQEVDIMEVGLLHRMAVSYLYRRGDIAAVMDYVSSHSGGFGPSTATYETLIQLRLDYDVNGELSTMDTDQLVAIAVDTTIHNAMAYTLYYEVADSLLDRTWHLPLEERAVPNKKHRSPMQNWVYPNPVTGSTIFFTEPLTANVIIYDLTGRIVQEDYVNDSTSLPLADLRPGLYIVAATKINGTKLTQKIVVR